MLDSTRKKILNELTGNGTEEKLEKTPVSFSLKVERIARDENFTLIEALAYVTEKYSLDPNQVPKLLTDGLKEKLALENGIEPEGPQIEF